jgi:hypothetical protein
MATLKWRGDAAKVAQINAVTPASVTIGNTFTVTINGKTITVTATAATVANVTGLLAAAITASTIPEFQEVTAADATTKVTLTARTAGVPFTQTSSSADGTGSAGHSLSTSATTANSGPNSWIAANFSTGSLPVDGDTVYLEGDVDILYEINQSTIDLVALFISGTLKIGLPEYNSAGYVEYRTRYLTLTADTVNIGYGDGSQSGRVLLSLGNNATVLNISNTGAAIEQGVPAVVIQGHASATYTFVILKGSVGIATELSQVCVTDVVTIADGTITLGTGCTLATVNQAGGTLTSWANITALNVTGGDCTPMSGTVGTLTLDAGNVFYRSTGTITTLKVGSDGVIDFTQDPRARTVTTTTIQASSKIFDTNKTVTWTNGIALDRCSLEEVTLDLGTHFTLLVSSPATPAAASYTALIGDGAATSYSITAGTHGLSGTGILLAAVYDVTTNQQETPDIFVNEANGTVTIVFSVAPTLNAKRVVIVGAA